MVPAPPPPSAGYRPRKSALGAPVGVLVSIIVRDQTLELRRDEGAHRRPTPRRQNLRVLDHIVVELHCQVPLRPHHSSSDCAPQYIPWCPALGGYGYLRRSSTSTLPTEVRCPTPLSLKAPERARSSLRMGPSSTRGASRAQRHRRWRRRVRSPRGARRARAPCRSPRQLLRRSSGRGPRPIGPGVPSPRVGPALVPTRRLACSTLPDTRSTVPLPRARRTRCTRRSRTRRARPTRQATR